MPKSYNRVGKYQTLFFMNSKLFFTCFSLALGVFFQTNAQTQLPPTPGNNSSKVVTNPGNSSNGGNLDISGGDASTQGGNVSIKAGGGYTGGDLIFSAGQGYDAGSISFQLPSGNSSGIFQIGSPTAYKLTINAAGDLTTSGSIIGNFKNSNGTPLQMWSRSGTNVLYSGGNVGIGIDPGTTTFKVYKSSLPSFEVSSSVSRLQIGMATCDGCYANGAKNGDAILRTLGSPGGNIILYIPNNNNDGNSYIGYGDDAHGIWMKVQNNKTVRIDGVVYSKEINVKTDVWSDFVFAPDYKLKTIDEVEAYIKQNQKLPDVPSEKEVLENGINVSEMNAILLQKIEETMLYVIELKKQNEIMHMRIESLESKQ